MCDLNLFDERDAEGVFKPAGIIQAWRAPALLIRLECGGFHAKAFRDLIELPPILLESLPDALRIVVDDLFNNLLPGEGLSGTGFFATLLFPGGLGLADDLTMRRTRGADSELDAFNPREESRVGREGFPAEFAMHTACHLEEASVRREAGGVFKHAVFKRNTCLHPAYDG